MGINRSHRAWRTARARVLKQSDICWLCGQPGADSVDHKQPLALGGSLLDPTNLRPAHLRCNIARGTRPAPTEVTRTSRAW